MYCILCISATGGLLSIRALRQERRSLRRWAFYRTCDLETWSTCGLGREVVRVAHDFSPEWRIFFILSSGIFFLGREHATLQAPKASHAQRTPLNMGGLACVTDDHAHSYTARTTGEINSTRIPFRLRTSTRGFDTTVELQQPASKPSILSGRLRTRQDGKGQAR